MTLCIAVKCSDWDKKPTGISDRLVCCADDRTEAGFAGGDIAFKYEEIYDGGRLFGMYSARNISKAREFCATCRTTVQAYSSADDLFVQLNNASAAHKQKLCEQLAQLRFGMSYQRVCERGAGELPESNRSRFFHDLEELDFECELIIFGFINGEAEIFYIDSKGEVEIEDTFAAIGSGGPIAEGNLFFRQQLSGHKVSRTLYTVYESARLAYEAKAPGVGPMNSFYVFSPPDDDKEPFKWSRLSEKGLSILEDYWKQFGPRDLDHNITLDERYFSKLD